MSESLVSQVEETKVQHGHIDILLPGLRGSAVSRGGATVNGSTAGEGGGTAHSGC